MSKPKYLITNLVYGDRYTKLFTRNHLKSLLDPTNIPAIAEKYDIELMIYTDAETAKHLSFDPNMIAISKLVKISSQTFQWPKEPVSRYNFRYSLIQEMVKGSIHKACVENFNFMTTWVADLVVAQEFFPRVIKRMEQHDAVFVVPLRSAEEAVSPVMHRFHHAMKDTDLCALGIECLHPLWVAANWQNPQFTKLPYTLLWQAPGGLLARTFQPTPVVFKPKKEMLDAKYGMIDGDIPAYFDSPYWASDWVDAPVMGVEPLICWYPPFANRPSSTKFVAEWMQNLAPNQAPYLNRHMYYPSKAACEVPERTLELSDGVVSEILELHGG